MASSPRSLHCKLYRGGATPGCFFFELSAIPTAENQLATVVLENQLFRLIYPLWLVVLQLHLILVFVFVFQYSCLCGFTACTLLLHNMHPELICCLLLGKSKRDAGCFEALIDAKVNWIKHRSSNDLVLVIVIDGSAYRTSLKTRHRERDCLLVCIKALGSVPKSGA